MIRGENSDSIPTDLVMEILSRLPTKSIARFRCVSKAWGSMLLSPYFTDLFRTRSSARPPRLLFVVKLYDSDWYFLTSPQPENPYEKSSSLVVAPDLHMRFPGRVIDSLSFRGHDSGLIYFHRVTWFTDESSHTERMICNPTTGQLASLPLTTERRECFLGFDPIDKQFKVLSISLPNYKDNEKEDPDQILTLGPGNDSWREIHCQLHHVPIGEGICINGTLYYLASQRLYDAPSMIVCFDVRSEKFKFIDTDFMNNNNWSRTKLINYKGKLGVVTLEDSENFYFGECPVRELCMWVIKDVERPVWEWSKHFSFRLDDQVLVNCYRYLIIVGVSARDDIVLSMRNWDSAKPFYVFYLSPERNTLQSVEIKGLGANQFDSHSGGYIYDVNVFVDYVEDLKFIMMKSTDAVTSSIIPPAQKRKPTRTSTTSAKAPLQQDCGRFESIKKFDPLRCFDDDEFT